MNQLMQGENHTKRESENVSVVGRWVAGPSYGAAAAGRIAYFGNGANLEIVDFTDLDRPLILGPVCFLT